MKILAWIAASLIFCGTPSFAAEYNHTAATTNAKLGLAYLQKGLYASSKQRLLSAIREDPNVAASWYSMAYYLEKTGDNQGADTYFRKAISVEPHSGAAINNYGTFLCRIGKYKKAIQLFITAAHEPSYLQAASAYENAGICSLMMGNKTWAMTYFHKAIMNNPNAPFSLLSLARLNHQMGNDAKAEKYFYLFKKIALRNKSDDVVQQYHDYAFSSKGNQQLPMG